MTAPENSVIARTKPSYLPEGVNFSFSATKSRDRHTAAPAAFGASLRSQRRVTRLADLSVQIRPAN